jgi:hypothetical protein
MTIELNMPSLGAEWNEIIINDLISELGESHIVTRVAKRIAAKGFELLDVQKRKGVREGFNWGRSSHAERRVTIREINFAHPENPAETFSVLAVSQIINYTKCNPYDRVPEHNGVEQSTIQAMDDAKAALGWAA